MSFVSSQTLQKLSCMKCNAYLSHFPIYESVQPRGTICGRCPSEKYHQRNIMYEDLAKSQLFPCRYDSNGCTENLLPTNVPQHEKYCYFRKYDCPTSNSTNCTWHGFANELLDHFEKFHPVFIIKPDGFEVDFVSSYDENCVLDFEEGVFIFNRCNNPKTQIISYNVTYVGASLQAEDSSYKIILKSIHNKSEQFEITNKFSVQTDISRGVALSTLGNPNAVITKIEIMKPEIDSEQSEKHSSVDIEMLRELECTVCFEYMLPPIHQCLTGHSICASCKTKHTECPSCKVEFKNTINITLGHLIEHLIYPCKNAGCKFSCKAKDIKVHQENCIFGLFKCPLSEYENCKAEINYLEIYNHVLIYHYENLLETDVIHMPFVFVDGHTYEEDCYIFRHGFDLFTMHCLYEDSIFSWAVQQIGSQGKNIHYKFEIDVIDNSGKKSKVCLRADCGPLTLKETAFDDPAYFVFLDYDQIKTMITEQFSYRVHVISDPN